MNKYIPDNAAKLLIKHYLNRQDVLAAKTEGGLCPEPLSTGNNPETFLNTHLQGEKAEKVKTRLFNKNGFISGRFRIGAYAPNIDNKTKWLCFDFDGKGHSDALIDPLGVAHNVYSQLKSLGFSPYLEKSGGGNGWHIWIFFNKPLSARSVRQLGEVIVEVIPNELKKTQPTDNESETGNIKTKKQSGIEVFPKQNKINSEKGVGNMVWLPFWNGAPKGANIFYKFADSSNNTDKSDSDYKVEPFKPSEFKTSYKKDLKQAIQTLKSLHSIRDEELTRFVKETNKKPTDNILTSDWHDWRRKVLSRIDLNSVYGRWLTGNKREGWLECRDPSSPSGDKHPSAGVATGDSSFERGAFHSFRTGESLSIFDFMVQFNLAKDFKDAIKQVSNISGVSIPRVSTVATMSNMTRINGQLPLSKLPQITVNNRQFRDVINDSWVSILARNNPPFLFLRAGIISTIKHTDFGSKIENVNENLMTAHLNRSADWFRVYEKSITAVNSPDRLSRDMLSLPDNKLPELESIINAPVFDEDGNLVSKEGYSKKSRLYYKQPKNFELPEIAAKPSDKEIKLARSLILDELLHDFPFEDNSDKTHAVAALILPFARHLIQGPTPLHLIEAPTPGTGKSLLSEAISIIVTGNVAHSISFSRDDEENRKRITSILAHGSNVVNIDNIRKGLDSAVLSSALTSTVWTDRWLGSQKMVDIRNNALWMATANNPRLSFEMARRCIRVRLDPKVDKPWQRTGFKYPTLTKWVKENRPNLVWAVLVLLQNWVSKGKPNGKNLLGSFESWSDVIGGILEVSGITDFLNNQDKLYEDADSEGEEWREFVSAWWNELKDKTNKVHELNDYCEKNNLMTSIRGDRSVRSQQIKIGRALFSYKDRIFNGLKITPVRDPSKKKKLYKITKVEYAKLCNSNELKNATNSCNKKIDISNIDALVKK